MAATLLRKAGEALYGEKWVAPMARALKVKERTIRDWMAGGLPFDLNHPALTDVVLLLELVEDRAIQVRREIKLHLTALKLDKKTKRSKLRAA